MKFSFLKIHFHREIVFILIAALMAITLADIIERFGYSVCKLCYYQRYIYWALVGGCVVAMLFRRKVIFFLTLFLLLVAQFVVSFFHAGVEKGWFKYDSTCATGIDASPVDNISGILNQSVVSCDVPQMVIYGLSMAAWNAMYAVLITIIFVYLSYANKQEKPNR